MSSRGRWMILVVVVLALVGLVISSGHVREDDPEPAPGPTSGSVSFPMPDRDPVPGLAEQARGLYVLEGEGLRFSLDLRAGSLFNFVSTWGDKPKIEAAGTWSLTGTRLTLTYTWITGRSDISAEKPVIAVNVWRGKSVELLETGRKERVILSKRTVLRQR
jgi:hypothetical protein